MLQEIDNQWKMCLAYKFMQKEKLNQLDQKCIKMLTFLKFCPTKISNFTNKKLMSLEQMAFKDFF